MRDERYYERLNQIRQKYGYLNGINPQQETNQSYQRLPIPMTSNHASINNYLNNLQIPLKSKQNHLNIQTKILPKKTKDNASTPPYEYGSREIETQRNYRQKQTNQQNLYRYSFQKPLSQMTSRNPPPSLLNIPAQKMIYSEYSSPIKMLKEVSSRTPRQSSNMREKSPTRGGMNGYRTQNMDRLIDDCDRINAYKSKEMIQTNKRNDRCTPTPHYLQQKQSTQNSNKDDEYDDKFNLNLNNIDKIQERIQAMLNKNRR